MDNHVIISGYHCPIRRTVTMQSLLSVLLLTVLCWTNPCSAEMTTAMHGMGHAMEMSDNGTMSGHHNMTSNSTMSGHNSHNMGDNTTMSGHDHHNMGDDTTMSGHDHHNMGDDTTMSGHDSHNGHEGGDMTEHSGGHGTFFFFSVHSTILFEEWITSSWQAMLGSCFGIGVLAALYEGLKVFREFLMEKAITKQKSEAECCTRFCTCLHLIQTLLHVVQLVVSYFLMLVFMTFNVWLCMAVAAGAGVGYLAFGWRRSVAYAVDVNEHCH